MEYIHLVGVEGVERAARQMSEAADKMNSAAATIASTNEQYKIFLDDWLQRLAGALEDHITMLRQS